MEKKNELSANIFIWCTFSLFFSIASPVHGGIHNDPPDVLEHVMRKWEATAIKTFEIDNHVIDCIDIYEQPAFQHPLLVNHTIQLQPSYYPSKTNENVMDWSMSESCPDGSIPIERAQPNGISQSNLYKAPRYNALLRQRQTNGPIQADDKHEYVFFRHQGKSYGGKAAINVWNPKVEKRDELSVSQMWVVSEDRSTSLEAGWLVYPPLNGNDQTRFVILYMTNYNYSALCYNLRCPGFVQTNKRSIINPYLQPVSVFGGQQYAIDVEIFMDKATGNWWLLLQGADMGYWPKELVPSLAAGAYYVEFGGEIGYTRSTVHPRTSTEMGSGHFAEEGFRKSSFIRHLQVVGADFLYHDPEVTTTIVTAGGCYDVGMGGKKDGPWGWFFFYGGPRRSQKCV